MRPLICNEMSSCQPRRSPSSGRWYGVVTLLSVSLVCSSVAWGQPPSKYITQDTTLLTKDGHEIKVSYFKSQVGQEADRKSVV